MANPGILDDLLKLVGKNADDAAAAFHSTLKTLPDLYSSELGRILEAGSQDELIKWFDNLSANGKKFRDMSPEDVKALTNPGEKAEADAFRKIADLDFRNLSGNAMKTGLAQVRGLKNLETAAEGALFRGDKINFTLLLQEHGVKNATDGPAAELIEQLKKAERNRDAYIEALKRKIVDPNDADHFDAQLAKQLETMSPADRAKELHKEAVTQFREKVTTAPEAQTNRDTLLGKITKDEAEAQLAATNAATEAAEEAKRLEAAQAAAEEAAKAERGLVGRGIDGLKGAPAAAWSGFKRHPFIYSGIAAVGTFSAVQVLRGPSGGGGDNIPQGPDANQYNGNLDFTEPKDIDDMDDAKDASKDNDSSAQGLAESYNKSLALFDTKIAALNTQITAKQTAGDAGAVNALTETLRQVEFIKSTYVSNPNNQLPEITENVHAALDAFKRQHQQIMAMPDDDAYLPVAKDILFGKTTPTGYVPGQKDALMFVESATIELNKTLQAIDSATIQAAYGTPPNPPLDTAARAIVLQMEQEAEARRVANAAQTQAAIQTAGAPAASVNDAVTRSGMNLANATGLGQHINAILADAKKTGTNSLAGDIANGLAQARTSNNQAEIDRYTTLQRELNEFIARTTVTAAQTTAKIAAVGARDNNVKAISSNNQLSQTAQITQSNAEIAAQGVIVKELFDTDTALMKELTELETAMNNGTTVAALRANPSNTNRPAVTGNGQTGTQPGGSQGNSGSTNTPNSPTGPLTDPQAVNRPTLPPAIAAALADAQVMANYNGGQAQPSTLSDGVTTVEFGIAPRLASIQNEIQKTAEQIAKIEQLQIQMRSEGKNAQAVELENNILLDMRTNLQTMKDCEVATKAAGREAIKAIDELKTFTQGSQSAAAQAALLRVKVQYDQVVNMTKTAQEAKNSNFHKIENNPATAEMLKDDVSLFKQTPNDLLKTIGGGKEGLPYQLLGDANGTGKSVAGSYLSLAWQKINDVHTGWKDFGRSQDTQSGRNWWMIADTGGKVVLGAMAINLFNNTLGSMAGFKLDGWKSLAILGVIAATALHGSGAVGRDMEASTTVRDNRFGTGPIAQGGGETLDTSGRRTAGHNIPASGSVSVINQRTGNEEQVASFRNNGGNITITNANGEVATVTGDEVNEIAKNIAMGSSGNVPSNFDGKSVISTPHSEDVADASLLAANRQAENAAQPRI